MDSPRPRLLSCLILVATGTTLAFNINTDIPTVFQQGNGSYFGYSTAFHYNGEDINVLVTATKGNYTGYDGISSGVLYRCDQSQRCVQIVVEHESIKTRRLDVVSNRIYNIDGSPDMWLGVSLDTQTKPPFDTMVCGHRWASTDSTYFRSSELYSMVGVCYRISKDVMMTKGNAPRHETQKLLPLYSFTPTIYYGAENATKNVLNAAMGMCGTAVKYSDDEQSVYMGGPGIFQMRGGVVRYYKAEMNKDLTAPAVFVPYEEGTDVFDLYTGYSVSTGIFYNNKGLLVALGSPRASNGYGKVFIAELKGIRVKMYGNFDTIGRVIGEQLGSYFGSATLSIKLAKDDIYHLLVVGAPLYSSKQGGDEGRVYVYASDGQALLHKTTLYGNKIVNSRFGSALANIGDVNLDGYNDIAVGAPYENDHGAVYIYHGTVDDIKPDCVQRIEGSQYGNRAKGFGISIARSADIDGNHYPDLLVGAYASDSAFLFKSHPIVQVRGSLNFSIANIERDNSKRCSVNGEAILCFTVSACLSANGKFLPDSMSVSMALEVDPTANRGSAFARGVFSIFNQSRKTSRDVVVTGQNPTCVENDVYIYEHENQDYVTPVKFIMTMKLLEPVQKGRKDFCPQCPVEDPSGSPTITREIPFATGCGDDSVCQSDLSIKTHLVGLDPADDLAANLVLGQNKSIRINVFVKNDKEPAFLAKMTMEIPPDTSLLRLPPACTKIESASLLECKVGNPLRSNDTVNIQVQLDITRLPNNRRNLIIKAQVLSTSEEVSPEDCFTTLEVHLTAVAQVDIKGYPEEKQTIFMGYEPSLTVNHAYEVVKFGPTPINSVKVTLVIPYADLKTGTPFVTVHSATTSPRRRIQGYCDLTQALGDTDLLIGQDQSDNQTISLEVDFGNRDTPSTFDPNTATRAPRNNTVEGTTQALGSHIELDCSTLRCLKISCIVGPFLRDRDKTTIAIRATLNMTSLNSTIGLTRNMTYATRGSAEIADSIETLETGLPKTDQEHEAIMIFLLKTSPPPIPLPKWIIAVSAGGGFLLLGLIIAGLVQLGFFQRKKHEELKRQLLQAKVVKEEDTLEDEGEGSYDGQMAQNETYSHSDPDIFKI